MTNEYKKRSREQWVAALSKLPEQQLRSVLASVTQGWHVQAKTLPQSGLGMLKMRDSALGDDYYMGEFPLSSCWLTVTTTTGKKAEGAAWIMDDNSERAEQMALCDAILSAHLDGWEQVHLLLELGVNVQAHESQERKSLLAKTRVDFSLLDDVGEQDD